MLAGVDIGGTFTDIVLSDNGKLIIHKLLSTPHDPSQAMLNGLMGLLNKPSSPTLSSKVASKLGEGESKAEATFDSPSPAGEGFRVRASLDRVAHGSTVATNAILERRGAKIAFITTQGFRDVLFIGRQNRPKLYALYPQLPPPLVERALCYEVTERLDFRGDILTPLDLAALDSVIDDIKTQNVDAIAVCLLYSFVNPAHEQTIRERIAAFGLNVPVALSSEVLPEFREYERASATVLEAYVRPVMARYVTTLENRLPVPLRIMKSDGGVMGAGRVQRQAIQTALSGPAAGVTGAFYLAKQAGYDHIITLDMGGTSTDVALCPGALVRRPESEIDGLPLRIRLLDIETVGAGGGSIARLDAGGALRVGPESAGADPGPISYGRGGTHITVSDANAVLGRLDAERFLGGRMALNIEAAREALQTLANRMNTTLENAALGVIEIANANIDRAVRRVSVARGYDPRDFTLVAFGGAGGLHACAVADRLEIPRVLIPHYPGVLCAFGLLVADVTVEYSQSVLAALETPPPNPLPVHREGEPELTGAQFSSPMFGGGGRGSAALDSIFETLLAQAKAELQHEGIPDDQMVFSPLLDMRYKGQAYELNVPYQGGDVAQSFHDAHRKTYGHALDRVVEIVNVRLQAVGLVEKPVIEAEALTPVQLTGGRYERESLPPGATFEGEALVFQMDSTTYIPSGWSARVDAYRNLVLERV